MSEEKTLPLPEYCDELPGYPLLCLTPDRKAMTREGRAYKGRWGYSAVWDVDDITRMGKQGMSRETIRQAARYLVDEILEEAGMTMDDLAKEATNG